MLKFRVGNGVRKLEYENIFAKAYTPNWCEESLWSKKVKKMFHGHKLLVISMVKKLLECSMKKSFRRPNKQNSGLKK